MFERGFLTVGRFRGIPIRFHWSMALGALFFGGLRFVPAFWLAFVVLVLVHELGHAFVARRLGHQALAVDVTGFGGLCHWDARRASGLDHSLVAWGGVAAQFALLLVTLAYTVVAGAPASSVEAQVVSAFTRTNLWIMALNLLPIPPLDGAQAWRLFSELKQRGLSPWGLLQAWAMRRRNARVRQPNEVWPNESAGPSAPGEQRSAGEPEAPASPASPAAEAELARLFEQVAEQAKKARERRK